MNWRELSNFIRRQFEGYEATPSSNVWSGIEESLDQGGRSFGRWLLLIPAFLGIAGGTYFMGTSLNTDKIDQQVNQVDPTKEENPTVENDKTPSTKARPASITIKDHEGNSSVAQNLGQVASNEQRPDEDLGNNNKSESNQKSKSSTSNKTAKEAVHKAESSINQASSKHPKQPEKQKKSALKPIASIDVQIEDPKLNPVLKTESNPNSPSMDKYEHSINSSEWTIGISAAPEYLMNKTDYAANEALNSTIEDAEKDGKGYSIELNAMYEVMPRLELQSGLWFSYYSHPFKHQVKGQIEQPNNNTAAEPLSTKSVNIPPDDGPEIVKQKLDHSNKFYYVGIPILMHYKVLDQRFSLKAGAGVDLNYLTQVNAKFIGRSSGQVYDLDKEPEDIVRTYNVNYNLRLTAAYKINHQWSLTATPLAKMNALSLYKDDFPTSKKPIKMGLGLGVEYILY